MKRAALLTLLPVLLAVPAAALAARGTPGDGTVSVKDGRGSLSLVARGGVIGRCDACTLTIDDPVPGDGSGPIVFGAERTYDATKTKTVWQGTDMRFRLIGGFYRLRIRGLGLNVSAVGNGQGWISGTGEVPDGVWSLNGSDYRSLPDVPTPFILGTGVGG